MTYFSNGEKKKNAFAFKKNSPIKYYVNVLWVVVIRNKKQGGSVHAREMCLCLLSFPGFMPSCHPRCWTLSPHSLDPLPS